MLSIYIGKKYINLLDNFMESSFLFLVINKMEILKIPSYFLSYNTLGMYLIFWLTVVYIALPCVSVCYGCSYVVENLTRFIYHCI